LRKRNFIETLSIKISKTQRSVIEDFAERGELSIGQAARELMDAGIAAKGLKA
jgi:hypothetical protein